MAKTQKYTDDQLVDAVIQYSQVYSGKIMASKLAIWARKNMQGLEEVQQYMFCRQQKVKDLKTGKYKTVDRPCAKKIAEINNSRRTIASIDDNPILRSANIDQFFELPVCEQRQAVVKTREQVDKIIKENIYLRKENTVIDEKNKSLAKTQEELEQKLNDIAKRQEQIMLILRKVKSDYNEKICRDGLSKIGITDNHIDLNTYVDSLTDELANIFDVGKIIHQDIKSSSSTSEKNIDILMEGLDFE